MIVALVALVLVGGISWYGYNVTGREKEPPPPDYEIYTVTRGDLAATVSATGVVEPAAEVNLVFRTAGPVAAVYVEVGDEVEAGQLLAELQTEELVLAREQAMVGLRLAQARLKQAQTPPDAADLAAAQAALESARASLAAAKAAYQDLLRGPSAAQRRSLEAAEKRAKVLLDAAQAAYNEIAHLPNAGMLPQAIQLQQATIDYEVAKANAEVALAPPSAGQKAAALAQIAQAESALAQAQASLERLKRGPLPQDLEILQIQVDQAQIAVDQAELALRHARIIAPIDGVVGAVSIRANEVPNPAAPAITLTDPSGYHVTLHVDEIDIGRIRVGQPARVSIDALEGLELAGVVTRIAPTAAGGGGLGGASIVTYEVRVDLEPTDAALRSGLTATVVIITDEVHDVVILPNRVMRLDRQTGQTYVEKIVDGAPRRVDLEIGLRNEQFSQILSGVEEGDQLAVRRTDTGEILRQRFFGGGD
ncbi:MAG: HlyD family efflux transporter periplasmic adaptor subunit [Chloroflexi bacterium]|nr:HlyD family efflux transporter periplasmic adaptor subunit [Chloroflexota bacterium]